MGSVRATGSVIQMSIQTLRPIERLDDEVFLRRAGLILERYRDALTHPRLAT
jgi:hypothetical protein